MPQEPPESVHVAQAGNVSPRPTVFPKRPSKSEQRSKIKTEGNTKNGTGKPPYLYLLHLHLPRPHAAPRYPPRSLSAGGEYDPAPSRPHTHRSLRPAASSIPPSAGRHSSAFGRALPSQKLLYACSLALAHLRDAHKHTHTHTVDSPPRDPVISHHRAAALSRARG